VASGHTADSWYPSFGQTLYNATWAFTGVVRFLFDLISASRLVAQLYAVSLGVVVAVLTTALAARVVRPRFALVAGLIVAACPSQVLWSSVALRESVVWTALALLALGFAQTFEGRRRAVAGVVTMTVALLALGASRDQTLFAAAWAVPIAALLIPRPGRWPRLAVGALLALTVPLVGGTGLGGIHIAQRSSHLGSTRTYLADGAVSSYTNTTLVAPATTAPLRPAEDARKPANGRATTTTTQALDPRRVPPRVRAGLRRDEHLVQVDSGAVYIVEESTKANLEAIPRGAVAVLLRPFLWEGGSGQLRLAGLENPFWYVLYVLAAIGIVAQRRRLEVIGLPILLAGGALTAEILIQGNVGTAFRHRGQALWALALLAGCGLEALARRREDRGSRPLPESVAV
jgi:hypothetical protein